MDKITKIPRQKMRYWTKTIHWVNSGSLGIMPIKMNKFIHSKQNCILNGSGDEMKNYAKTYLGYNNDKGLDFIAKFNGKHIIAEAKFLTNFGGHQNAQFNDAMNVINSKCDAIKIAILDGVLYIPPKRDRLKMSVSEHKNIMSALVLRDFLYQI